MMNIILDLSVAVLTSAAATTLFLFVSKTYLKEKISASVKSDYDHKIESFKSELGERQSALMKILESQSSGYNLGQSERLISIKLFWENFLKIRDYLPIISSIDSFISVEETNDLFNDQRGKPLIEQLRIGANLSHDNLTNCQNSIESVRPFLNDEIWVQTAFLTSFLQRILYLYNRDLSGDSIEHWSTDKAIMETLQSYLAKVEYDYIIKRDFGRINLVKNFVEQKIIAELYNIINGKAGAKYSMEHALTLVKLNAS